MLLRSSSTPILTSFLTTTTTTCSFSDSPTNQHQHQHQHPNQPLERTQSSSFSNNISFCFPSNHYHHHHHSVSNSFLHSSRGCGFRRVSSEGLMDAGTDQQGEVVHHLPSIPSPMRSPSRRKSTILETVPSFSIYGPEVKDPGDEEEFTGRGERYTGEI